MSSQRRRLTSPFRMAITVPGISRTAIFEYINIVGHRDDVLALWPPNAKGPVAHVVEPHQLIHLEPARPAVLQLLRRYMLKQNGEYRAVKWLCSNAVSRASLEAFSIGGKPSGRNSPRQGAR
jgi:hypothetical protein